MTADSSTWSANELIVLGFQIQKVLVDMEQIEGMIERLR